MKIVGIVYIVGLVKFNKLKVWTTFSKAGENAAGSFNADSAQIVLRS